MPSAMMNSWNPSGMRQGGSYWQQPSGGGYTGGAYNNSGGYGGGGYGGYGDDMNPQGAANDPFAYTGGSLLTPWEGHFNSQGYGGGYSVPAYNPFSYQDFSYNAPDPGRFTEQYQDPAAFRFADFNGPSAFKAPTAEDMKADPGYQARMDAMQKGATAAAAHGGTLNTGGFARGLASKMGDLASQEYGNTYNRKSSEWDRNWGQAKDTYGINQGNTKQAFDTNTANRLAGHNTRQNDWAGNANVALQQGQLGYNIAQGTWDRNEQLARQGWSDRQAYDQSVAAAGAANANQSYERDLSDYNRARDEFWTNQDRQYGILDREANRGMQAAGQYGNDLMQGWGAMGNMAIGAGDARASGAMGSGSAWGNFAGDMGNMFGGMAMYGSQQPTNRSGGGGGGLPYMTGPSSGGYTGGYGSQVPGTRIGGLSMPTLYSRNLSGAGSVRHG